MTYILVIILICFALPYIARLAMRLLSWYVNRRLQRMARSAFGMGADDPSQGRRSGSRRSYQQPPEPPRHRRGKRIDPTVGEYIDYEEIDASSSRQTTPGADDSFTAESQVVDAEWEEI